MRFTLRLLLLVLMLCSYTLRGQSDLRVSYAFNNTPLAEALDNLSAQTGLTFSYADDLVTGQNITARANQLPLPKAMRRLLRSTPIDFKIVRESYVLLLPRTASSDLSLIPDKPVEKTVFQLRGTITDAGSGEGIPYATISVVGAGSGGYSDLEGGFDFEVTAGPQDSVEFSSLGYQSQRVAIEEATGSAINPKLTLASVGLQDIVVTAYLTNAIRSGSDNGEIQFSPADIELLPGQAEPDILQSLLLLPGVSSATESVADINIRGGTADQNLVLWDNIPVYHTGHYFGSFTAFNPFIVDEVNVWRGGHGAEYGGRVSGVIDIKTSEEVADKPRVGAGFNLTHAHVYGDVPLVRDKLSLLFSARRAFTDIFPTITFNNFRAKVFQGTKVEEGPEVDDEEISVTDDRFVFADLHAKLRWQPSAKDRVSVSFFSGNNDLLFGVGEEDVEIIDNLGVENFGV
ncbi:MAG: carboxypeptidase-like regulatory domain-containing protein, partial [Bacteroidota bacterium]